MILGVIGCGKMGSALVKGVCGKSESAIFSKILLHSRTKNSAEALALDLTSIPTEVIQNHNELIAQSDLILLCVKPNQIQGVLESSQFSGDSLLVSIAAGVTISQLSFWSGGATRIVRVMPNTPSLIGEGASVFCHDERVTEKDVECVRALLSSVGMVRQTDESLMDAITGLSGSGPAYVYTIIEALSDAGVRNGLPRADALSLALQTVKGAAMMVEKTGLHPAMLRDAVTSPGGTTIAGLTSLEKHGLRNALISAVDAATERSRELGNQ